MLLRDFAVPELLQDDATPVSYTHLVGVNVEGLKRRGFTPAQVSALRDAYKIIYRRGLSLDDARAELRARQQAEPEVAEHLQTPLDFLDVPSRGIIPP